jgi:glycosyltransferase involved in cell wall biosynthesis
MGLIDMGVGLHYERPPCVSVGMPVFNGERYLDGALRSLLAQDFTDFELIVCDNASTDATAAIAADWATKDPRVRVVRNETNIGAERNFNRVFTIARGRYFRWAAHDDLVAPEHLRRCVMALEASPDAVLSTTWAHIIDAQDRVIGFYDGGIAAAESTDTAVRFAALVLSRHLCTDLFGLIRSDALRKTGLHGLYYGADRALLAELSLLGRFVRVPLPLFFNREHPGRVSRSAGLWRDAGGLPSLILYSDYRRAVASHVTDPRTRSRCRLHLWRWWASNWNFARVIAETITRIHPPFENVVHRLKLRVYGSVPQVRRIPSQHGEVLELDEHQYQSSIPKNLFDVGCEAARHKEQD